MTTDRSAVRTGSAKIGANPKFRISGTSPRSLTKWARSPGQSLDFNRGHRYRAGPLEVGEGIRSVAARLLDEGEDDSTVPAGFLADEHSVLVTELGGSDGVFGEIVVELDLAVHEAEFQMRQLRDPSKRGL